MNLRLVCRLLGRICLLIGAVMVFSMPWAYPRLGIRNADHVPVSGDFEHTGFGALAKSVIACLAVGILLSIAGRGERGKIYRKESMAVVGLSWVLATILGALPFYWAGVCTGPAVRMSHDVPLVHRGGLRPWQAKPRLTEEQRQIVEFVLAAGVDGRTEAEIAAFSQQQRATDRSDHDPQEMASDVSTPVELVLELVAGDPHWRSAWRMPGEIGVAGFSETYRIRQLRMSWIDAMFESQSGFSTTGATVISQLEDPRLVPHCLLFWRSSTHFLGGLGIIVLFVVILGQGSAGKALMRAELPGPTEDRSQSRIQHAAWAFAGMYVALNIVLVLCLKCFGLTWFDALCHAFATMATGGFSTYNASLGHFQNAGLETVVVVFMILAGSNFALLMISIRGRPLLLLRDVEFQTYAAIILLTTALIVAFGLAWGDFASAATKTPASSAVAGLRYGLFQVVSIMTTTGYGTHDTDQWNDVSKALLFLLMFIGACAGSTGGGVKVIRCVLLSKVLHLELEQSFHPSVVRPLKLAGKSVDDPRLNRNILVYFMMVAVIFILSSLVVVMIEPDTTWPRTTDNRLVDSASIVAATLNNIGPGFGTVGATKNYAHLSPVVKLLCTWLMMLGRVEVYVILCLFLPRFWR